MASEVTGSKESRLKPSTRSACGSAAAALTLLAALLVVCEAAIEAEWQAVAPVVIELG